ncbi:MAG: hypothetical protein A4E48_00977 [Methanosaeta sp. PtaU1.Bin060]|jgi:predicted amidohydrolase|nr:MAG: hypothetical protein A4E48_00977 [Methanosaeta sp. PtaU1.Bin060]
MKKTALAIPILIIALVIGSCPAQGHRMFIGQKMTIDLYAIFDDGEAARNATVQIYRDGELYAENKTDSTGRFTLPLPGKGTGDWRFLISEGGHEESAFISIKNESRTTTAAAGLALILVPAAFLWRRRPLWQKRAKR